MAIIPSDVQFVGIAASVNLTEKKSSQLNSETQPYTMQDIIDTAGGGGTPAGTAGQIQFSDGSAFAADSNLFWDNTNKRLGVGTSSPGYNLHLSSGTARFRDLLFGQAGADAINNTSLVTLKWNGATGVAVSHGGGISAASTLHIKGSGSTSATTSLLVQNSAGTELLKVRDDNYVSVNAFFASSYIQTAGGLTLGSGNPRLYSFNNANANLAVNATGIVASTSGYSSSTASAVLEAVSTSQGFLPPRMTTTQKNAISTPAAGLQVYDTTLNQMSYFNGSTWVNF